MTHLLTLEGMLEELRKAIGTFPDARNGANTQYAMEQAGLGASIIVYVVFFLRRLSGNLLIACRRLRILSWKRNTTLWFCSMIPAYRECMAECKLPSQEKTGYRIMIQIESTG